MRGQHRVRPRGRQQGRGRRRDREGRACDQASHADQPAHHQRDGAARRARRIRWARPAADAPRHRAGTASVPPLPRPGRLQGAGDADPRDRRQCRRRVRHEGRALSRVYNVLPRREAHGRAGEMGRRAQRKPARRRALPRQHHGGRARARCRRQVRRLPRPHAREYRRLLSCGPQRRAAHQQYRRALRHLRDPGRACRGQRRAHQHDADRPLSGRRTAGSSLRDGNAGRPRGAQARDRSGRAAPAQHHPGRRDAVPDRAGLHL